MLLRLPAEHVRMISSLCMLKTSMWNSHFFRAGSAPGRPTKSYQNSHTLVNQSHGKKQKPKYHTAQHACMAP